MENSPWRIIILAAGASLVLLVCVYFFALPRTVTFEQEKVDKILEFKSAYFSGREDGKKVWEFYAEHGWAGKDNNLTYLENVSRGKFYKNGDVIVKELKAPQVTVWQSNKLVQITSRFSAVIAFTPKGRRKYGLLQADTLQYNPGTKRSVLTGHISLKEKEALLFADNMTIDHENEVSSMSGGVQLERSDLDLSSEAMDYNAKEEKMICNGKVRTHVRTQPSPTTVDCGHMELFTEKNNNVTASGSVELFQGKKTALGDSFTYSRLGKSITIFGKVRTVIEKGKALIKAETAGKMKSSDAKQLLAARTRLNSDRLELLTQNGDARAFGNVQVFQKGKEAKANEAVYSEKYETIDLSGKVYLKKTKQWIRCRRIIVSVKDETFDAYGSVEAEFKIKK